MLNFPVKKLGDIQTEEGSWMRLQGKIFATRKFINNGWPRFFAGHRFTIASANFRRIFPMYACICVHKRRNMDRTTYFAKRYLLTTKHLQTNAYLPVHYIHLTTAPSTSVSSSYWTLVHCFLCVYSFHWLIFQWKLPSSSRSSSLMIYLIALYLFLFVQC